MASFFDSGPLPDWKEIKKWLGKDIPWDLVEKWDQSGEGDWLEKFVKRLLKDGEEEAPVGTTAGTAAETLPDASAQQAETRSFLHVDTVKQDKKLIVTVRIPQSTNMRDLRLFATADRLRVLGLPGNGSHSVRFPCRVFARTGKAVQKGGRIEIAFKRRPAAAEEVELFIEP